MIDHGNTTIGLDLDWTRGGFTQTLDGRDASPAGGRYAVSLAGREQRFALQPGVPDVLRYIAANYEDLNQPHHYLGGWVDEGNYYLDCSILVNDLASALAIAETNGQLAIYDVGNGVNIFMGNPACTTRCYAAAV